MLDDWFNFDVQEVTLHVSQNNDYRQDKERRRHPLQHLGRHHPVHPRGAFHPLIQPHCPLPPFCWPGPRVHCRLLLLQDGAGSDAELPGAEGAADPGVAEEVLREKGNNPPAVTPWIGTQF